jgi:hypothetical protein
MWITIPNMCLIGWIIQNSESRVAPSGACSVVWLTFTINMSPLAGFRTQVFRHGLFPGELWSVLVDVRYTKYVFDWIDNAE